MNLSGAYQIRTVLLIVGLQILNMLEIVGVDIAFLKSPVGEHIIGKLLNLQVVSLLSHQRLYYLQNLRMGRRSRAHYQRLQLSRRSLALLRICGAFA